MIEENKPKSKINWKKIITITIGFLVSIMVVIPIGLNFYLKNRLPDLVNEKTPYQVRLNHFAMDIFSGDLLLKNVIVNSKNPKDSGVTYVNGSIKELEIKNFKILNFLLSKDYKAESLKIISGDLNIKLADVKNKKPSKKNDFTIENIFISDTNVNIVNSINKPFFRGKNINIDLQDIRVSEERSNIPIAFKKFLINATDIIVPVNDNYRVKASEINAKNKVLELKKIELYPSTPNEINNKKHTVNFDAQRILIENFDSKNDALLVENVVVDLPYLLLSENKNYVKETEKKIKKDFGLNINLKKFKINGGELLVEDNNKMPKLNIDFFDINFSDVNINRNTIKNKLPFIFGNHHINLSDIFIKTSQQQDVRLGNVFSNNRNIKIDNIQLLANGKTTNTSLWSGKINQILIENNKTRLNSELLKLEIDAIKVIKPSVIMIANSKPKSQQQKPSNNNSEFEFYIGNLTIENGAFSQIKDGKNKLIIGNVNAYFNSITKNPNKASKTPFLVKSHDIVAENFKLVAGNYYNINVKTLSNSDKKTSVKNLELKPKYSRKAFSKVIKKQEDLYDISVKEISVLENLDVFSGFETINLKQVTLDGINASIYHDLAPPNDTKHRTLFSEKLRSIQIPLFIKQVDIKNSYISYEEDALNNNKPGKFFMNNFNTTINNVGNGKIPKYPTLVDVKAQFNVFGTANSKVNWSFDVLNKMDDFKIDGNVSNLSANDVNLFVRPYLNISVDGKINFLKFNYYGNKMGIKGQFLLNYNNIYVNLINKKTGQNKKLLSKAVNVFIRNDSKVNQKPVNVNNKRDPERSFFNMLWKAIMEGLGKTLT